nr:ubiquilin-1-like [Pogona vitticeps]
MEEVMGHDPEAPPLAPPALVASSPSFIRVTAKSPTGCAQFVLPEASTVLQLKEEISKRFHCEPHQLVLVFFGRILKEPDTLRQCGVGDGTTVHLMIRSLKREEEEEQPPRPPYGPGEAAGAPAASEGSLASPRTSRGSWAPQERSPSSAERPLGPASERILQKVRRVILANPEIQRLAQQVPALSQILNHMGIMRVILDKMREIMELAKNPEMAAPDPKGCDQSLISLQSNIPGGDNPLSQLSSSDAQEPAGQDLLGPSSPFATLARSPCSEPPGLSSQGLPMETQEGRGALPLTPSSTSIWSDGRDDEGRPFHTLAGPLGKSSSALDLAPAPGTELFNAGGLQAPEAAEIPMLIVNLCNAYTKRMMFSLMQNALLDSDGALAAQPEHVRRQVLHFSEQMQSPEMVAALANPRAIQAWVQMEQGLQGLAAEAPVLIPWFMLRLRGLGNSAGGTPGPREPPCQGGSAATE